MPRRRLPALVGLLALAVASPAVAQDVKFNAQHARFDATGTGLGVVAGPDVLPAWRGGAGVLLHVADKPFALYSRSSGSRQLEAIVQQSTMMVQLHGGFGFGGIADLSVVVPVSPVIVWGTGADGIPGSAGGGDGAGMGDITLIPKVQILSPKKTKFVGFGVQIPVGLPTGHGTRYLGDGGVNVALDLLAEFRVWKFRILANVSPIHVRPRFEYGDIARQFGMDWRGGLSFQMFETLALRAEAWGTVSYVGTENRATSEWAVSVSMTPGDIVQMEIGVGSGLGGFTTPGVRAFAGARFTIPGKPDLDAVEETVVEDAVETSGPVDSVPPEADEVVEEAEEAATEAVEEAADESEDAIDEAVEDADEAATEAAEEAGEAATDAAEATEEAGEAATEAAEEADEAASDVVEEVEEAADAVEETAAEAVEEVQEATEKEVEEAADAVEEAAEEIEEAAEEAQDAAEDAAPADEPAPDAE